jgi:hypothetical protein
MDGLIEQAKSQLWNMVGLLGKADCNGVKPSLEIALYEYGRTSNPKASGFVKKLSSFTNDLDSLSAILFSLNTDGGDEYCGEVIYQALDQLKWDPSEASYKVIFIAGNEDFLQGSRVYTTSCGIAAQKGVVVNTIYCGDKQQGIKEHWNLGGECGKGSYTNINSDVREEDIPTPYDTILYSLNSKLNHTYLVYGNTGYESANRQQEVDKMNMKSRKAALGRIAVKGKESVYVNSTWDMADAYKADSTVLFDKKGKPVPVSVYNSNGQLVADSLKGKTAVEVKQFIESKNTERSNIQNQITQVSIQRTNYLADERRKRTQETNAATLETEIERILKEQAKRYNMKIE